MSYAPIVLFVYNRADHFKQTFEALSACAEAGESELFVFADGAKDSAGADKVEETRQAVRYAADKGLFKRAEIIEAEKNMGLARSVISGVTRVIEEYGRAIVLEDDSVCAPTFLRFMNVALDVFESDRRVGQIAGFTPALEFPAGYKDDVFTCWRSCSCAWATWADRWRDIDWELKDVSALIKDKQFTQRFNADGADRLLRLYRQSGGGSSWSVRFGAHLVKNGMLTVYPRFSLVQNIGGDGSGVHSTSEDAESMAVDLSKVITDPEIRFIAPDPQVEKQLKKHYSGGTVSDLKRFAAAKAIVFKESLK